MASNVAPWTPAPTGDYLHDHDPQGNALSGPSDDPRSMPQPMTVIGKHGQRYPDQPNMDGGFCNGSEDGSVPNAADPNTGNGSGIKTSQFAKG